MPSAAYFRRQADICLRLSLIASDNGVSSRLIAMAKDYMATSQALEQGTTAPAADQAGPAEPQAMPAAYELSPDTAGRRADT
jgi:hypothetical protein